MIAIDTNVLLRYLLLDDVLQAKKAAALINGKESVLVSNVVLAETVWTLTGKKYKLKPDEIAEAIQALFHESNIFFEHPQTVWRALSDYRRFNERGTSVVDFSDALVLRTGKAVAKQQETKFKGFYTFDVAAQRLPDTRSP